MKNKVLRLAIVAVLVVAMVLSMAACEKKPVNPSPVVTPTPTKTPDVTVAPSTPTPSKTPEVSTDEAKLEAEYGITFPVPAGMKVDFDAKTANLKVVDAAKDPVVFGALAPTYNNAFNAYKDAITVTAKVNGLTAEGKKIDLGNNLENNDGAKNLWVKFTPKAAGTYTVVYTVKVAYDYDSLTEFYGFFKPAKINETYTVTKTYEVAKKAITIESKSDAFTKAKDLKFVPSIPSIGGLEKTQADVVLAELNIGEGLKYDLAVDIVSVDLTAYGTYPLNLVCTLNGKAEKVDVATLVSNNFDVTFKNGNRYVLTDVELAAAAAALDDVTQAASATSEGDSVTKEEIDLGISTYAALTDGAKTWFNQDCKEPTSTAATAYAKFVTDMNTNQTNLSKLGLVQAAQALAKTWKDKLKNAVDGDTFVTYMLSLSAEDFGFVKPKLVKDYEKEALVLVKEYKVNVLKAFATQLTSTAAAMNLGDAFNKKQVDDLAKAVVALQTKYDALAPGQSAIKISEVTTTDGGIYSAVTINAIQGTETISDLMAMATKGSEEFSARYAAYETLIEGLDAYTSEKATSADVSRVLGYNFTAKKVNNKDATVNSASPVLFAKETAATSKYIVFATPMLFVNNAVKEFKKIVDAYVALDAAIVSAQNDVNTTLGSKIILAVAEDRSFTGFSGVKLTGYTATKPDGTSTFSGLQLLQKHIATTAIANVKVDGDFTALAKKELSVVIAAALKDPVATVNGYIKEDTAFSEVSA